MSELIPERQMTLTVYAVSLMPPPLQNGVKN